MYKNIYDENDPWYLSIGKSAIWKLSGLLRKLKRGPRGILMWWKLNQRCKAINKQLLEEANKMRYTAKYPDPTPRDVEEFVDWAQSIGIIKK
jgi:hypothetical protein